MAIGNGNGTSVKHGSLQDESRRGSWLFAVFMFFWTASNSIILPWLPQILIESGLSYKATGGVIAITIIVTIISVKISQTLLTCTKKGFVRRLIFLFLLIFSLLFQVTAVFVLENKENNAICPAEPLTLPVGVVSSVSFDYKDTYPTTKNVGNITSISHNITNKISSISQSSVTINVSSTLLSSVATDKNYTPISTTDQQNITKQTSKLKNTTLPNILTSENQPKTTTPKIEYSSVIGNISIIDNTSVATTALDNISSDEPKYNELKNDTSTSSTRNPFFANQKDESLSYDNAFIITEKVDNTFTHNNNLNYNPSYSKNSLSTSLSTNLPSSNNKDIYTTNYKTETYNKNTDKKKHHKNRNKALKESIISYLQNDVRKTPFQKYDFQDLNSRNHYNNPNPDYGPNQQPPDYISDKTAVNRLKDMLNKLIDNNENYDNHLDEDQYASDLNLQSNQRWRFKRDVQEIESNAINSTPYPDYKVIIEINYAVAVLLILCILLGSGIEPCITKLWHCIWHGYHHIESLQDDILDKTISSNFHMNTYGEHKGWTAISNACWVILMSILVGMSCLFGIEVWLPFKIMATVQTAVGIFAILTILLIPIPSGTIEPPRTKRPLSLYLDDEVLREGIRRLSFHFWVFSMAFLGALPNIYKVLLLLEIKGTSSAFGAQICAVSLQLIGEGLAIPSQRWFMRKFDIIGLMGLSAILITLQSAIVWMSSNIWVIAMSSVLIGFSEALHWICVKQNALLLATIHDQEKEADISWLANKLGTAISAGVWGIVIHNSGKMHFLFVSTAAFGGLITCVIGSAALITKSDRKSRRRVYHTLDLYSPVNEDEDDSADEDDWLVKRAKREGINL